MEGARKAWERVVRHSGSFEDSEDGSLRVTRRDIQQWGRRQFSTPEALDPALKVLVEWATCGPGHPPTRHHAWAGPAPRSRSTPSPSRGTDPLRPVLRILKTHPEEAFQDSEYGSQLDFCSGP
jgi:hypothetical protein